MPIGKKLKNYKNHSQVELHDMNNNFPLLGTFYKNTRIF